MEESKFAFEHRGLREERVGTETRNLSISDTKIVFGARIEERGRGKKG